MNIHAHHVALIAVAAVSFLTQYQFIAKHQLPTGDEGHYVEVAANIAEGRGYVSRLKHHFYPLNDSVEHPDDTRQPLVPHLFALLFTVTGVSYPATKTLLVCFNTLNIFLIHALGTRLFDRRVALTGACFAGFFPTQFFFWIGVTQPSEPVFTSFLIAAVWLAADLRQRRDWILLGVVCGLAYLTRASGLWLFLAVGVLAYRRRSDWPNAAYAFGAFVLVCSPWFIRNMLLFGNPIYTSAQHNYWLDSFRLLRSYMLVIPGPAEYVASHSALDALERIVRGFYLTCRNFALVGANFEAFLPFLVYHFCRGDLLKRLSFFYLSLAITALALIWYAPAYSVERFFVPFHGLIILLSIGGLFEIASALGGENHLSQLWRRRVFTGLTLTVLALGPLTVIYDGYADDDTDRRARLHELVEWIRTQTGAHETVMTYSPDGLHQLQFEYDRKTVLIPNNDLVTILYVARQYEVDYIVISKGLLRDQDKGL